MPNVVERVPASRLVDTNAKLSPSVLASVHAAGFLGVIRYVPLPNNNRGNDIDAAELGTILTSELGLMLVQHSRFPGWDPAKQDGAKDAAAALAQAKVAGYMTGAHIFLDLEGILPGASAGATSTFANAWADAVVAAGYLAGCYVGFDVPLNAAELFALHNVNSYWSDMGPRAVATRGFAMRQRAEISIGGVEFDPDVVAPDLLGETPMWMRAATQAVG